MSGKAWLKRKQKEMDKRDIGQRRKERKRVVRKRWEVIMALRGK